MKALLMFHHNPFIDHSPGMFMARVHATRSPLINKMYPASVAHKIQEAGADYPYVVVLDRVVGGADAAHGVASLLRENMITALDVSAENQLPKLSVVQQLVKGLRALGINAVPASHRS